MSDLHIPGTQSTPAIRDDWQTGRLSMQSDPYPENSYELFGQVVDWVKCFLIDKQRPLELDLRLLYLNTSSIKATMDILGLFKEAHQGGRPVSLRWRYDRHNERAAKLAGEFREDCSFPFVIQAHDEWPTTSRGRELDAQIDGLLTDPQFHGHPLHQALTRLRQQSLEQLVRLERITRISDGFQSMARERNLSLSKRYHRQLRRLEGVTRVSNRYQQMMRDLNLALKEASIHDPLTGLPNRHMLLKRLREENEHSRRHGQSYVLAMLDVDFFKQVNDTWDHDSGDRVLVETARVMESELHEYDLCGRWGGEEFLLLLPQTRLQDTDPVLERVRDSVRTLAVRVGTEALGVAAGVSVAEHRIDEAYSQTVNRVDAALLDAKRNGRGKCTFAAFPPLPAPSRPTPAR